METLYVANSNGGVEAYNATTFARITLAVGAFTDSMIPACYTPYGIQAIGTKIYVAFSSPSTGVGGSVDSFNTAGTLQVR